MELSRWSSAINLFAPKIVIVLGKVRMKRIKLNCLEPYAHFLMHVHCLRFAKMAHKAVMFCCTQELNHSRDTNTLCRGWTSMATVKEEQCPMYSQPWKKYKCARERVELSLNLRSYEMTDRWEEYYYIDIGDVPFPSQDTVNCFCYKRPRNPRKYVYIMRQDQFSWNILSSYN